MMSVEAIAEPTLAEERLARITPMLRRARALLQRGWCQGSFGRDIQGRPLGSIFLCYAVDRCLEGALYQAAADLTRSSVGDLSLEAFGLYNEATDYLRALLTDRGESNAWLAMWNDRKGRTQEDVLRLLDRALEGK